jgi:predicted dinucleotide-binding enzyme
VKVAEPDYIPLPAISLETSMKYSIVGSGLVGATLAGVFARHGVDVLIASSRGPDSLATITAQLGSQVAPVTVDRAIVKCPT